MFLRGATEPPPGSADYFTYHIRALARSKPFADFNDDGVVDAADYVMLREAETNGGIGVGSDALTAGVGYVEWAQQFGETTPDLGEIDSALTAAMSSFVTTSAIPEPAAAVLAIVGGLILASCRRRK